MPPTLNNTHECRIIRKIFSNCENTDKAIEAFMDLQIPPEDMAVVVRYNDVAIQDRDYHECHHTARRWLANWAHFKASPNGQVAQPLVRNASVGISPQR